MTKTFVGLFIAAVIFCSCQKEISGDPGNGPSDNTKLIVKQTHNRDEWLFIDTFIYDLKNRCTSIYESSFDSNYSGSLQTELLAGFHYNGDETLPYKITDSSEGRDMNWYVFYDSQKRVIKDSVIFLRGTGPERITRYNYNGNRLVALTTFYGSSTPNSEVDTLETDGTNYTRYSSDDFTGNFAYQVMATYDTHPSAFTNLNVAGLMLYGITSPGNFSDRSKNNPLTMRYIWRSSPSDFTKSAVYTYDTDGYPLSRAWTDLQIPRSEREKFEYRK